MESHRLHVFIEGWVQGVGFRYATAAQARTLALNGWVRNLPDGRVEAEFEGPDDLLKDMLQWCAHGPQGASVAHVSAAWETGPPRHAQFQIRP